MHQLYDSKYKYIYTLFLTRLLAHLFEILKKKQTALTNLPLKLWKECAFVLGVYLCVHMMRTDMDIRSHTLPYVILRHTHHNNNLPAHTSILKKRRKSINSPHSLRTGIISNAPSPQHRINTIRCEYMTIWVDGFREESYTYTIVV